MGGLRVEWMHGGQRWSRRQGGARSQGVVRQGRRGHNGGHDGQGVVGEGGEKEGCVSQSRISA